MPRGERHHVTALSGRIALRHKTDNFHVELARGFATALRERSRF